jgi:hypothetical protein
LLLGELGELYSGWKPRGERGIGEMSKLRKLDVTIWGLGLDSGHGGDRARGDMDLEPVAGE